MQYATNSQLSVSLNKSETDHLIFSSSSHDEKYQLLIVGNVGCAFITSSQYLQPNR